jgi:hypothetical protein
VLQFEYRLAYALGKTRKQLLRELDARELLEWQVLEGINPYGQLREDFRFAVLSATFMAAMGAKKQDGTEFTSGDFLLTFKEAEIVEPIEQTAEQQAAAAEMAIKMWVAAANAKFGGN